MNCLSAPFRAARGVKNEYTHCGSTRYSLGVMVKIWFLWIGIRDGLWIEFVYRCWFKMTLHLSSWNIPHLLIQWMDPNLFSLRRSSQTDPSNIRFLCISDCMSPRCTFIIFIFHGANCSIWSPWTFSKTQISEHFECEIEWNVYLHLLERRVAWKMSIRTVGQLFMVSELWTKWNLWHRNRWWIQNGIRIYRLS